MLVNLSTCLAFFGLLQSIQGAKQSKNAKVSKYMVIPSKSKASEVNFVRVRPLPLDKTEKNAVSPSDAKPGAVLFQSKSSESNTVKPGAKIFVAPNSSKTIPLAPNTHAHEKSADSKKVAFETPFGDADFEEDDNDVFIQAGKVISANQTQPTEAATQQKLPEGKVIFSSSAPKVAEQKVIFSSTQQPSVNVDEKVFQFSTVDSSAEASESSLNAVPLANQPVKPKKLRSLDESAIESLEFDANYTGPRIDLQFNVTMSFVKDTLVPYFKNGGLLDRKSAYSLFYRAFLEFSVEDTLEDIWLEKDDTLVIFGDIHGQMHDFLQVLDHEGYPRADVKYLFNGDIVDRGAYSVECLLILMALKVAEPDYVFVSLGNHETMTVGKLQFFKESVKKYGNDEFFRLSHMLFKSFPVSFLLEDEVFITHGGLSPFLRLERIRMIDRLSPSHEDTDIINDLTWSDPVQQYGIFESQRGLGYLFGPDITKDFLQFNNISAIIRSHQFKETGYSEQHDSLCITVFSCPNYRGTMKNQGAYLKINKELDMEVKNFVAASTVQANDSPVLTTAKILRNLKRDKSKPLELPAPQK